MKYIPIMLLTYIAIFFLFSSCGDSTLVSDDILSHPLENLEDNYIIEIRYVFGNVDNYMEIDTTYQDTIYFEPFTDGVNVKLGRIERDLIFEEKIDNIHYYRLPWDAWTESVLEYDEMKSSIKFRYSSSSQGAWSSLTTEFNF